MAVTNGEERTFAPSIERISRKDDATEKRSFSLGSLSVRSQLRPDRPATRIRGYRAPPLCSTSRRRRTRENERSPPNRSNRGTGWSWRRRSRLLCCRNSLVRIVNIVSRGESRLHSATYALYRQLPTDHRRPFRFVAPIGCPDCSSVAFCGRKCRDVAMASYHKYECKVLALLIGSI